MTLPSLSGPSLSVPTGANAPRPAATQRLDQATLGRLYASRVSADPRVPERDRQLEEIGFHAGEQVMVMTRGFPDGEPLVVRIGQSTFALRRDEAACVEIEPLPAQAG
jgi:ferrous iron transport protein A